MTSLKADHLFHFQIIAPLEFVMNAAIFDNFVHSHPDLDVSKIFVPESSELNPEKNSPTKSGSTLKSFGLTLKKLDCFLFGLFFEMV